MSTFTRRNILLIRKHIFFRQMIISVIAYFSLLQTIGCNPAEENNLRNSEVDAIFDKQENEYLTNYSLDSVNGNAPFHLFVIRRAPDERIVYRLRCTTAGSKCFENISGKFRVVYQIPDSIPLERFPYLQTRTGVYEEIGLTFARTTADTISVYSTFASNEHLKPVTSRMSQSIIFNLYAQKILEASEGYNIYNNTHFDLVRSVFHVQQNADQSETITSISTTNPVYPNKIISELSVTTDSEGSGALFYRFEVRPEHYSQFHGTGHRTLPGRKPAKMFNVEHARPAFYDERFKTDILAKNGFVLKIENIFEGDIFNKILWVKENGANWRVGTPGQGFYINLSGKEVGFHQQKFTVKSGDGRTLERWDKHPGLRFNLYRQSNGYEIIVNHYPTNIIVPFSQVAELSRSVHFVMDGKTADFSSDRYRFEFVELTKDQNLGYRFSNEMQSHPDNWFSPNLYIPSDIWVGTNIFKSSPQIRWNNGTEFLGSIFTVDATGQNRWIVSQGVYNQNFTAKFNANPVEEPIRKTGFVTQKNRGVGRHNVVKRPAYPNQTDLGNNIAVYYRKPGDFVQTYFARTDTLNVRLATGATAGEFSLPPSANEIGVTGKLQFNPTWNRPHLSPGSLSNRTDFANYFVFTESSNPEVLSITRAGYFEIHRHGQGAIYLRDILNNNLLLSVSFNIGSRCPEVVFNLAGRVFGPNDVLGPEPRPNFPKFNSEVQKVDHVCVVPVPSQFSMGARNCSSVCNNFRLNRDLGKIFLNSERHSMALNNRERCERDQYFTQTSRNKIYDLVNKDQGQFAGLQKIYHTHFDPSVCGFFDQYRMPDGYLAGTYVPERIETLGNGPLCPCNL